MNYQQKLAQIIRNFPNPETEPMADGYLMNMIFKAIDKVNALKGHIPIFGVHQEIDYQQAKTAMLLEESSLIEKIIEDLVIILEGLTIVGHPATQENVIPPVTNAAVISNLIASLCHHNLVWDKYSHKVREVEVKTVAIMSNLMGYNPKEASGYFTFGGTGTVLSALKVGLEKAIHGAMKTGIRSEDKVIILVSDCSHYCCETVAGFLGIGTNNIVKIATTYRNEMDIEDFRSKATIALSEGKKIAGIVATMGTTDAFGVDNLAEIIKIRDQLVVEFNLNYTPHIHADAVISWVWTVFNNYDWLNNPLEFHRRTIHSLVTTQQHLSCLKFADSIGIDFHKTGFVPCVSSLVLFKNGQDLKLLQRKEQKEINYLFGFTVEDEESHPGLYTLETSRSGSGVLSAYANLKLLGREGFQCIIGHLIEMTELLRDLLSGYPFTTVLNDQNYGTVTLFRVYPEERVFHDEIIKLEFEDPSYQDKLTEHNQYNQKIYQYLNQEAMAGRGVAIGWTKCYRFTKYSNSNGHGKIPIPALKSFILSPFIDKKSIETVVKKVLEARDKFS